MRRQRTCVVCGRVGTRVFRRSPQGTVCRNEAACVIRLCDKLFLDKPKPKLGSAWVSLGVSRSDVRFYDAAFRDAAFRRIPTSSKATMEIAP